MASMRNVLIIFAIIVFVHFDQSSAVNYWNCVRGMFQCHKPNKQNGRWEKDWTRGRTPWDLGEPTPILMQLLRTGALPEGRALIPGCGSGYDVAAIASPKRFVVGLDLSETCITLANEKNSGSPNAGNFEFVKGDFLTWEPTDQFDLIFNYVFFCAIEPRLRVLWAKKMSELLKPDGLLITLVLSHKHYRGKGAPYKIKYLDYVKVLEPLGFELEYVTNNEMAVGKRKGREKLALWRRKS